MIKEYIIRIDDLKHDKMLVRKLKALCKEYEGEYYTRVIDKAYTSYNTKLIPKSKDSKLYWRANERDRL